MGKVCGRQQARREGRTADAVIKHPPFSRPTPDTPSCAAIPSTVTPTARSINSPPFPAPPPPGKTERHAEAQEKHQKNASYQPGTDPLSGMGIGLPVSRLYARHFGGDLKLMSLEGFGCVRDHLKFCLLMVTMVTSCPCSQCSYLNVLTVFPSD